jgi:hypothetical protein
MGNEVSSGQFVHVPREGAAQHRPQDPAGNEYGVTENCAMQVVQL